MFKFGGIGKVVVVGAVVVVAGLAYTASAKMSEAVAESHKSLALVQSLVVNRTATALNEITR